MLWGLFFWHYLGLLVLLSDLLYHMMKHFNRDQRGLF